MKKIESIIAAVRIQAGAFMLLLSASFLFLLSFKTAKLSDEIWKELGISRQDGNYGISTSFMQGYFYYYGAKNARNIAVGNRAAVVRELGAYAKEYVNSEAFKKEYFQDRETENRLLPNRRKILKKLERNKSTGCRKPLKAWSRC